MKIEAVTSLVIPDVKVVRFSRFRDDRGYFTESFSHRDLDSLGMKGWGNIEQANESYSVINTIRGLHFQWNPHMGKFVRTVIGHMYDLVLDIRLGSSTFGKIVVYDMPALLNDDFSECIWVPPGFAHGNIFMDDSLINYLCTGEYSPDCEASISIFSEDIDWSLCDSETLMVMNTIKANKDIIITDKDMNGYSLEEWKNNLDSQNFRYE